ncbi:MAG: peptide chain release factor N(5)-glutamine methyltransferase [Puia sp.]|nr:peptide chain release factor N(5)-glutamine methyltransferase [Puia sp.]
MTLPEAKLQLLKSLRIIYDERESATIADWVLEKITGLKKIDRILLRDRTLPAKDQDLLEKYTKELQTHRPVQYVLGESWFGGLRFRVDERVLIPRPETEELVEWIHSLLTTDNPTLTAHHSLPYHSLPYRILDIGTGSGCIPITLKSRFPAASVFAGDISEDALTLARQNAADNGTPVNFFYMDILQSLTETGTPLPASEAVQPVPVPPGSGPAQSSSPFQPLPLSQVSSSSPATQPSPASQPSQTSRPVFDLIVSNPPYIPQKDRQTMQANVLSFEPSLALFVEDDDPFIFYRAIAAFADHHLSPGGSIFIELHEDLAEETIRVFRNKGFEHISLKKDMQGKDRMIRAAR